MLTPTGRANEPHVRNRGKNVVTDAAKEFDTCAEQADHVHASAAGLKSQPEAEGAFFGEVINSAMEKR
jgi:hypothetical protein